MYRFRFLLSVIAVLMMSSQAVASHLLGGEITWECKGNGQYEFTLKLYRDCTGINLSSGSMTITGPQGTFSLGFVSKTDVSPSCYTGGSGFGCNASPVVNGSVEEFVWRGTTSLTGTPPPTGWEFYWSGGSNQTCCRPSGVENLVSPASLNYHLRAKMYPYTPVGATQPLNASQCYDSSPYFSEGGSVILCTGEPFTYNHLAADKEADSLYFRWAQPMDAPGTAVNWTSGYSYTAPYPNPNTNPANGPLTLDGRTGEINMNIQSAPDGWYASCYAIEAWKCGETGNGVGPVKVAEVYRDVAIYTISNCPTNNEPNVLLDTALWPNIQQLSSKVFTTSVYPGDTIEFELSASNLNEFNYNSQGIPIPQNIKFQAEGLQASKPYASGTGCNGELPCAEFHPVAPQTGYTKALNNNIRYFWVPDCQHLTVTGNYCSPFNTFYFSMRMEDDGCPAPRVALTTFIVNVIIGDPTPVTMACVRHEPNGDVGLSWHRALQDSALEFNYYTILGSANRGGTYDTIQKIYDMDSLSTTVNGAGGYKHFYIVKSTGKCDFFSRPSDTLNLMDLNLTATPPGNAEIASLSWNHLLDPLPWTTTGFYEVWSEAPAGSGNWVKIGETSDNSYSDTVTVCGDTVNYQIRVTDTIINCESYSDIESAYFTDQTNNDQMVLDSVSVNAGGNAVISWQPTQYGDVVEYNLYYNDPKLGWSQVDVIPVGSPMPYEWAGSNADQRSEEFRVVSVDSCGNQSDDQIVKPHKSIYLKGYVDKCEAFARVSWNNYQGFGKQGVAGYELMVQTTANGVTSGWNTLFTGSGDDTSFVHNNLQNGTEYCYRVKATDTSGTRSSTSNLFCELAQVPQKSRILYLAQVTNNLDRKSLELNFFVDGQADVESFDIERAPRLMGPYQVIGTVGKPATAPFVVNFNDYGVNPDRNRYYYRVSATDSCGGRDTLSNIGTNIILRVEERSNLTNFLTWNPYADWDGDVAVYNIYRKAADETKYTYVGQVQGDDTTYVDDIKDYRETQGNFCYYVEAVEGPNSLTIVNPQGLPYTSLSNEVCMNMSSKVFIPSGFRPGSDIEQNRSFGPSLKFTEVETYQFYIMNRWGVKIFETDDPSERWDGTEDGDPAAQGVYIYYLEYATPGDHPHEQRGSFMLVR